MDVRYLVVEALGKLGPAADALLAEARKDEDATVRNRATALLKSRQRQRGTCAVGPAFAP